MDQETESKGSCHCAEVRIELAIEGEIEGAVGNNSDEWDEDEDAVEEDEVDGEFEELHEEFDVFLPDEGSYQ